MEYDRQKAVVYAHEWALKRNPRYYSFNGIGGDCTSFISQCLYAGCETMNYTRDTGWYYRSSNDRAPAWTSVEYLHRFLTTNRGDGPSAVETLIGDAQPGDIVQLRFNGEHYAHSLFIVAVDGKKIFISTHSDDCDSRLLDTYLYRSCRLLHIVGNR